MRSPWPLLAVTASRLLFAAMFAVCCVAGFREALLPLALFVELSDLSDGFLARRLGLTSDLGNIYDGMADHLARVTEFISLMGIGLIGTIPVLIFLWRDGAVATTRLVASASGARFPATRISGKAKGIAQGGCIVWLAATQSVPDLNGSVGSGISTAAITLAVGVSIVSALDYLIAHRGLLLAGGEAR
jgi:CDP-diacylglycerol--glycerol-3-phosphate 3-phosphatidyltransferase